jgi:bifunctional UDP-N-acetylglucosamine pyrophosphorylase / glucosamine-1-phosphate N-acetyltransferase
MGSDLHIVVLAAGQGKRMYSAIPKVLHEVLFRPLLHYVLDVAYSMRPSSVTIVVGHGEEAVRASCSGYPDLHFVRQAEQKGTGHALQQAVPFLREKKGRVLVLCGDVALLTPGSLAPLIESKAAACVLFAEVAHPKGYGRIVRNGEGTLARIQEEADCSEAERRISEVNSGVYTFELKELIPALEKLTNNNKQGEFYLTDALEVLVRQSSKVELVPLKDALEMTGVNDRAGAAQVESILRARTNAYLLASGVSLQDPKNTWIDSRCEIAPDVRIESGCQIIRSTIAAGCAIESGSRIVDSKIGPHTRIKQGSYIEGSSVGEVCVVGPYAHLRPGTVLERNVKLGNFVEVKKSHFAEGAKASHLAYIGDATIGRETNLGCGFITCNYDGTPKKNQTVIGARVFVGSDSQTVAPVTVGDGSYIASGTTVTENVPPDSLVISRGRQTTKPGYAAKYKPK